jgi:hypothetical protein
LHLLVRRGKTRPARVSATDEARIIELVLEAAQDIGERIAVIGH